MGLKGRSDPPVPRTRLAGTGNQLDSRELLSRWRSFISIPRMLFVREPSGSLRLNSITHPASSTYSTINAHESLELLVEFQGLYRAYCFPPFCGETKTVSSLCGVVSVVKDSKDSSSAKRIDDCTRVWNQTICFAFDGSQ